MKCEVRVENRYNTVWRQPYWWLWTGKAGRRHASTCLDSESAQWRRCRRNLEVHAFRAECRAPRGLQSLTGSFVGVAIAFTLSASSEQIASLNLTKNMALCPNHHSVLGSITVYAPGFFVLRFEVHQYSIMGSLGTDHRQKTSIQDRSRPQLGVIRHG